MIDIASFTRLRTAEQVPVRACGLVARSGSNPQPFAPSSCTTCKKAQGSIAVQALELPNENQTRIRTPCTKLAFPLWHFFFQIQIWTSRQDCVQKNTNGKIPVSNSRAGYPKIAQPVTCETRKCSTASDGEVLYSPCARFKISLWILRSGCCRAAAPTSGLKKKKRSFEETCQMLQSMVWSCFSTEKQTIP